MNPIYTSEADILRIGSGFADCTLPHAEWTHAAHYAAALWLMRYRPDPEPLCAMPEMIRAYNESVGRANTDQTGYHETITLASLRALRGVLDASSADTPIYSIVNALMASSMASPNWLLEYWSKDRLMSVAARRAWLEPDLKALPF